MAPLKTKATEWINALYEKRVFEENLNILWDGSFYFKLAGFADEPEVYIRSTSEGLEFGYEATQWEDNLPSPIPGVYNKQFLSWDNLRSLNKEQQHDLILELLMKTIRSRKRQYCKCQFCHEKVASEHRFDENTCQGCATEYLGVLY